MYNKTSLQLLKALRHDEKKLIANLRETSQRYEKMQYKEKVTQSELRAKYAQKEYDKTAMHSEYLNYSENRDSDFESTHISYLSSKAEYKKTRERYKSIRLKRKELQKQKERIEKDLSRCRLKIKKLHYHYYHH